MSISQFTKAQIDKLSSGDGYYLKVVENEEGENTWSLIRLNCVQQFFRWLGLCFQETHLQLIGERIKNEQDVPQELKERILSCWTKTFFEELELVKQNPVLNPLPEYAPLIKALSAFPERKLENSTTTVDKEGQKESIPAKLLDEPTFAEQAFSELAINPADYQVTLKKPDLKRLTHNICSSEIFSVGFTSVMLEGGDLLRTNAQAIVNPTTNRLVYDPFLDKENRLTRAIHTAAGPELNDFCETIDRVHAGTDVRLKEGNAVLTTSGELEQRGILYIVHTPVSQNLHTFGQSVTACLEQAAKEGIKSIAFPLLNMENSGLALDKVVEAALFATREFLNKTAHPFEVVKFVFKDENEDNAMEFVLATASAKELVKDWFFSCY